MTDEDSLALVWVGRWSSIILNIHQRRKIMETGKSSLFSACALAIVTMLAASNSFAQTSCTSKTTSEGAGNFIVNVNHQTQNGISSYLYSIQNVVGKNGNPNKFFAFVKQGLNTPPDLVAKDTTNNSLGAYVTPHQFSSSFPPADAWKVVHHQDGVVLPSLAIGHQIQLQVSERYKPEEGVTTILLGIGNTYEHCGPILGPTTPAVQEFQGSPLVSTTSHLCFENGCCYFATAGLTDNIITNMTDDPNTPFETVCGPSGCQACHVTNSPNICEIELDLTFCPPTELGRPPLQSVPGGTCYCPPNLKYPC